MEHAKPMLRRCAIYTRKSSEEGLEQNFNSLHAHSVRRLCRVMLSDGPVVQAPVNGDYGTRH